MSRRACVIGHPVAHSRSPLIHRFWLRAYGIDGAYDLADVAPLELPAFLATLSANDLAGANVTLPHKLAAFDLCDDTTETARRLGAVNTLWMEGGKLLGDNTDVAGFLGALDQDAPGWDKAVENAVVLGAGGAARAVAHALLSRGISLITLVNRTDDKAVALAALFGPSVHSAPWENLPFLLPGAGLLVNTTSLGMKGQPPLEVDLSRLPVDAIVDDIVYVPLETPLLAGARARGLRAVGGLGMLLHQAVPGFEHWFGHRPAVTPALRAAIEADIIGRV